MATEVLAGGVGERRAASTASGGTALTTTATYIQLPLPTSRVRLTPRNFATAVVVKYNFNPWLVVLKSLDLMVTAATDLSKAAQDADASTDVTVGGITTLANGGLLLVGSHLPFRGAYADVDTASTAAASTLAVTYWNGAWTSAGATDGTSDATRPFAQDGLVYWTVPTDWIPAKLSSIYSGTPASPYTSLDLYWTRWVVSVAVSAGATLNSLVAANRSTVYDELAQWQTIEEHIKHGQGGIGCIEALTDAGTANLIVGVATNSGGRFA